MNAGDAFVEIAFTAAENCCRGVARIRGVLVSVDDKVAAAFDMVAEGELIKFRLTLVSMPGGGELYTPLCMESGGRTICWHMGNAK